MKIGTKIILIIITLVVISATAGGIIDYVVSKQVVEQKISAHLESVATLKGNQFSAFLEDAKTRVEEVANEKGFLTDIFAVQNNNQSSHTAALDGMLRALLQERLLYQNNIFEFLVLDLNGEVLVSTNPQQEEKFRTDEEYFIKGQATTYVHNFYHDIAIGTLATTISTPIKDTRGAVIGVLAGRVSLDSISKLMAEHSGLGATGETYLVNKFNTIISGTRADISGEFTRMIYTAGIKDCLAGKNGEHFINYANIPVIGVHKWIPDKEMCLVAEANQAEAYSPINYLRLVSFLIALGSVVFTVLLGDLLSRSLSRPILMLRENAKQITEGNLDTKISITTKDEIGELAADFGKMTAQLRTYTKNLEEERAKLVASINSLPLGFILFDIHNHIVLKNRSMESILEEKDTNITAEMIGEVLKKAQNFELTIDECIKQRKVCEFEKIEWKNKILRIIFAPIVVSQTTYKVADDRIIGYVLIVEDVTKTETLNRTRDEFFSIASHELRTPLTAIRGNSEMLKDILSEKISDKKIVEMITDIHESSKRLIGIVNDFLDISRLEQKKIVFAKEKINVSDVVEETVRNLTDVARERNNSFVFIPSEPRPLVLGDRTRISQIIFNLLGNAINYTEKGTISISVNAYETNFVKVSVTDTGMGIAQENQKFLFQKFQQAAENIYARTVSQSIGLGLYTSKLLVEAMGGKIWLEKSERGKGSTFSFILPVAP